MNLNIDQDVHKIGLIADAHGNPLALRGCIEKLRSEKVSEIFFLGDAVGYLPLEGEVLSILETEGVYCIMGNHEAMLCGILPIDISREDAYGLSTAKERVGKEKMKEIASWPKRLHLVTKHGSLLLVHGSPFDELKEYVYENCDLERFGQLGFRAIFLGHTHRFFSSRVGDTLIVNVGSCGLSRDTGWLASCAIYNIQENTAKVFRLSFDVEKLIAIASNFGPVHKSVINTLVQRKDVKSKPRS